MGTLWGTQPCNCLFICDLPSQSSQTKLVYIFLLSPAGARHREGSRKF